ncbi:hypothetical protein EKO23_15490 [Nocardioides guangzhouensis]|uniref:Uncharacterized protein n=1 Tax=Nocardioides guangzhouensis TaxID=2497878 RepID=A0A4Q4ZA03_9ACTN|nr:hypothetical protein [Nocardioides guangzhouensis]RYP84428.1 hypothetical protein EKO23_15490 [Nocardioides guangzhouensis]
MATSVVLVLAACTGNDGADPDPSAASSTPTSIRGLEESGAEAVLHSPAAALESYAVLPSGDVLATWYVDAGFGEGAAVWIDSSGRTKSWRLPVGRYRALKIAPTGFLRRRAVRRQRRGPRPPAGHLGRPRRYLADAT